MKVDIKLFGMPVGQVVRGNNGVYFFKYDPYFLKNGNEISPIIMPLSPKIYTSQREWQYFNNIPPLINDSLPDAFGTRIIEQFLISKGYNYNEIDALVKLQYVGNRGMGALEYLPSYDTINYTKDISLEDLQLLSEIGTSKIEKFETNIFLDVAIAHILQMGTSAGGARAKAVIAINKETGTIKSGQQILDNNYEHYLIKIDGANKENLHEPTGFGRLEYTYYQMAKECGIKMMHCELFKGTHFMTRRFDRKENNEKVHVQTLCAMRGLDYNNVGGYSYDDYFQTALALKLGRDDQTEIFSRMVFNVAAQNCDDHTKNFSFLMANDGQWKLSPAYDICYSYNASNEWVKGHNMVVNTKRKDITTADLMNVGKRWGISQPEKIIEKIRSVVEEFPYYSGKYQVKEELSNEVKLNLPKLKSLKTQIQVTKSKNKGMSF